MIGPTGVSNSEHTTNDGKEMADSVTAEKSEWRELFQDGRGLFTLLVIGGVALHALNVLIIAIVMLNHTLTSVWAIIIIVILHHLTRSMLKQVIMISSL